MACLSDKAGWGVGGWGGVPEPSRSCGEGGGGEGEDPVVCHGFVGGSDFPKLRVEVGTFPPILAVLNRDYKGYENPY